MCEHLLQPRDLCAKHMFATSSTRKIEKNHFETTEIVWKTNRKTTENNFYMLSFLQGSSSQRPVPIPLYISFQQTLGGCGIINIGSGATLVQPLLSWERTTYTCHLVDNLKNRRNRSSSLLSNQWVQPLLVEVLVEHQLQISAASTASATELSTAGVRSIVCLQFMNWNLPLTPRINSTCTK